MDFEDVYNQAIQTERNLIEDIRFSRKLNLDPLKKCSGQICGYLNTNLNFMTLLNGVQDKNPYMYSHPVNVAFISFVIGKWLRLNNVELKKLVCSGLVHDIGKAKVRDSILNKPDKLNEKEMEIVRAHPVVGYRLLDELDELEPEILIGVLSHHERNDGSGYPIGLKGDQISLFGRIIAISDIYDAMTANKAYQEKTSPFKAVEEIQESSFASLDPKISQLFLKHITDFYSGTMVRLSNELIGEIVYVNPEERTKPLIRCENEFHNLSQERKLEIIELL